MTKRLSLLIAVLVSSSGLAQAPATGPVDGIKLPPADTGRVRAGMLAPDFTLESFAGSPFTLSAARGRRNIILSFYRGHW